MKKTIFKVTNWILIISFLLYAGYKKSFMGWTDPAKIDKDFYKFYDYFAIFYIIIKICTLIIVVLKHNLKIDIYKNTEFTSQSKSNDLISLWISGDMVLILIGLSYCIISSLYIGFDWLLYYVMFGVLLLPILGLIIVCSIPLNRIALIICLGSGLYFQYSFKFIKPEFYTNTIGILGWIVLMILTTSISFKVYNRKGLRITKGTEPKRLLSLTIGIVLFLVILSLFIPVNGVWINLEKSVENEFAVFSKKVDHGSENLELSMKKILKKWPDCIVAMQLLWISLGAQDKFIECSAVNDKMQAITSGFLISALRKNLRIDMDESITEQQNDYNKLFKVKKMPFENDEETKISYRRALTLGIQWNTYAPVSAHVRRNMMFHLQKVISSVPEALNPKFLFIWCLYRYPFLSMYQLGKIKYKDYETFILGDISLNKKTRTRKTEKVIIAVEKFRETLKELSTHIKLSEKRNKLTKFIKKLENRLPEAFYSISVYSMFHEFKYGRSLEKWRTVEAILGKFKKLSTKSRLRSLKLYKEKKEDSIFRLVKESPEDLKSFEKLWPELEDPFYSTKLFNWKKFLVKSEEFAKDLFTMKRRSWKRKYRVWNRKKKRSRRKKTKRGETKIEIAARTSMLRFLVNPSESFYKPKVFLDDSFGSYFEETITTCFSFMTEEDGLTGEVSVIFKKGYTVFQSGCKTAIIDFDLSAFKSTLRNKIKHYYKSGNGAGYMEGSRNDPDAYGMVAPVMFDGSEYFFTLRLKRWNSKIKQIPTLAAPFLNLIKAIGTNDILTFRSVFSRRIQDKTDQADWGKNLKEGRVKLRKRYGEYRINEFSFTYKGDKLSGSLSVYYNGKHSVDLKVVFEEGKWKLNSH